MAFSVSGLEERSLFEDADFVFSQDHLQSSASKTREKSSVLGVNTKDITPALIIQDNKALSRQHICTVLKA